MIADTVKSATRDVYARWLTLRERPVVQRGLRILQTVLFLAIIAYLFIKITHVGWAEVFGSLPASPWFYIFFVLRFLALPVSELAIYEIVWSTPLIRHFFVFVRKRVYNFAVMGYSGEAFLTVWARRRLTISDRKILIGVKDNNLLSAFASNAATVVLILAVAASGGLQATLEAFPGAGWLFSFAFLTAGILSVLFMTFRERLMTLPMGVLPRLLSVHGGRQVLIVLLQAAMYASALPGASLMAWSTLIAMQLVLSRVPFLPNQDIVYLGAALTLSPIVGAPEAAVAGMLVAEAGLSQLFNIFMFLATAHLARTSDKRTA